MYLIQREEEKQVQRFSRRPESLVDSIWRSFAVLSAARQLSLRELFVHISNIRLGAILKVLPIPLETVNELILRGQAGNVARYAYLFECVNEKSGCSAGADHSGGACSSAETIFVIDS